MKKTDCRLKKNKNLASCKKGNPKKKNSCNEIWNLLGVQYKPRDKILKKNLQGQALKTYNKMNKCKKIQVIDNFQSGGYFD